MLDSEQKAGLYVTIIIHLVVIIVCLLLQIHAQSKTESTFVLDFTKQEEIERQQQEAKELQEKMADAIRIRNALREQVQSKLADVQSVRNIPVNPGKELADDRGTDSKKLYEDAKNLDEELRQGYKAQKTFDGNVKFDDPVLPDEEPDKKREAYTGASVLSWQLDGRSASKLPPPSYKCYNAGTVTVIISVNHAGKVVAAKVQEGSSSDRCLRDQSVIYAKRARFNGTNDPAIPDPQTGNITYEFIAQ